MTIADRPHGRSRYTAGCRCGTCKRANREYARRRRTQHLTAVTTPPPADLTPEAPAPIGAVVAAVQAQLADLPAALERPGVTAVAVKLAEVLDNDSAVPQHAAAARALIEILGGLHKSSARRARLSAVRSMTERD